MDVDKLVEKLIKWLSEPRGREMLKTFVYLILPLLVLVILRGAAKQQRPAKKTTLPLKPKFRPQSTESLLTLESLKETQARERQKIEKELREVFGLGKKAQAKAQAGEGPPAPTEGAPGAETSKPTQSQTPAEELFDFFLRRRL